ncbi:MAG: hypothetical protein ACI4IF_04945 [Acutalibacteraceae bacterium]
MKKECKLLLLFNITLLFLGFLSVSSFAVNENVDDYLEEYDFDAVVDSVDSDTLSVLSELGITEVSFEKIYSVNISKVFNVLFDMGSRAFSKPFKTLSLVIGILIVIGLGMTLTKNTEIISVIGSSAVVLCLSVPITNAVTTSLSVLDALNIFTTAFAGVFCALVSSSGNIALGTSYASLSVISNTVFSMLLSNISKPCVNAMCSLSFLSCFDVYKFCEKLSGTVKKVYIWFLGFIATLFSGIVTLKGVMGASADTITSRGVRFVVGRTLPVVGGVVSDTYSTLIGSLSLIKNTVGVFGIITVVLTIMPSLLEILGWLLALTAASLCAQFLNNGYVESILNVLKDVLILLGATVIFSGVIFVVSVGVVIFVKGI